MANCYFDGTVLTELTGGVASNYVCASCGRHFMGMAGILYPVPFIAGGTATFSVSSTTVVISHGLNVCPAAGDIVLTPANSITNRSGSSCWLSAYSSLNFVITTDMPVASSGISFAWHYAKM